MTHTISVDCGANGAQVGPTAYNPLDGMGSFDCFFADGPATTNVTATVTDSDGAADTDAQLVTVTVANVAPTVTLTGAATADEGDTVSFSYTTSDPGSEVFSLDEETCDGGTLDNDSFNPVDGSGSFDCTFADNATYNVSVTVSDGDQTGSDTIAVIVANVAPVADAGVDQTVDEGDLVSQDGSFSDAGSGDSHTFLWQVVADNGQVIADATTEDFSFTPFDNGSYSLTFTVTDDDGDSDSDTALITVDNVDPTVDAGADQSVDEGDLVSLDPATFTDAGSNDTHTASIDWGDGSSLAVGSVTQTDGLSGTVDADHTYADNGIYSVTVCVSDDDLAETCDTLEVTVANVAPVADAGADQTVDEGDLVSQDGSFSDAGSGDSHTFLWQVVADNGQIIADATTEDFSFTPFDNGSYSLTFTVTDDDGDSDSDTALITVDNVDPTVDAGADQSVDEGDLVSLDPATFTDAGSNDTHTASIDWGDGSSLAVGSVTQTDGLSGTVDADHTYADNGIYSVTVCVSDDDLAETCDTLEVTVANVDPIVTLTGATPVNEGDTVTYSYTLTDAGTPTASCWCSRTATAAA